MEILATALILIGGLAAFAFGIWLLIIAFRESVLWGLAYFFIPFASLVFVAMHWEASQTPFLSGILSILVVMAGALLLPDSSLIA